MLQQRDKIRCKKLGLTSSSVEARHDPANITTRNLQRKLYIGLARTVNLYTPYIHNVYIIIYM
jgi:hypothetical protein